jgi:hypothetical protein
MSAGRPGEARQRLFSFCISFNGDLISGCLDLYWDWWGWQENQPTWKFEKIFLRTEAEVTKLCRWFENTYLIKVLLSISIYIFLRL